MFGDRVLNLSTTIVDNHVGRVFTTLAFHLGEERGEAIVVIHGPAIEGVVVALGALNAGPHENLGDILGELLNVLFGFKEVGRRAFVGTTGCRE